MLVARWWWRLGSQLQRNCLDVSRCSLTTRINSFSMMSPTTNDLIYIRSLCCDSVDRKDDHNDDIDGRWWKCVCLCSINMYCGMRNTLKSFWCGRSIGHHHYICLYFLLFYSHTLKKFQFKKLLIFLVYSFMFLYFPKTCNFNLFTISFFLFFYFFGVLLVTNVWNSSVTNIPSHQVWTEMSYGSLWVCYELIVLVFSLFHHVLVLVNIFIHEISSVCFLLSNLIKQVVSTFFHVFS